jgi:hypothetical protein
MARSLQMARSFLKVNIRSKWKAELRVFRHSRSDRENETEEIMMMTSGDGFSVVIQVCQDSFKVMMLHRWVENVDRPRE